MPYKQKESKYWYIRIPDGNGNKHRRSSGTTDFREAEALENKLNVEEYNRTTWGQEPDRYFDELMERYLSETEDRPNYERNIYSTKQLKKHFTGKILNDLPPSDINEYKRIRNAAQSTVRKELILFSTAINYACREWGWTISNPIKGRLPPKGKGRIRWLKHDEADCLIEAANQLPRAKYLVNVIKLALNTGMRPDEMMGLSWDRVDFENKAIYFEPEDQKSKKRGSIPLNPAAIRVLKAQTGHHRWVFYFRKTRIKSIRKSFNKACEIAGISNFTPHDLRHTYAAWAVQMGIPIKTLQELMRHEDIASTMIYAHLAPENIREASDLMTYDKTMTTGSKIQAISANS